MKIKLTKKVDKPARKRLMDAITENEALTEDEIQAIQGYMSGDEEHQATIDFDEASKRWLLED